MHAEINQLLFAFKEPVAGPSGYVIESGESGIGEINVSAFYSRILKICY